MAGLWALRLYESALLRQTESGLVAQAAVLASIFREQLHIPSGAGAPGTPPQPAPAALQMARQHGLDFALDPILPPEPDDAPGPPAAQAAAEAGRTLTPVLRDAQLVTLASIRITDRHGVIVATTGSDIGRSLLGWTEAARVLSGEPIVSTMHRREPAQAVPGGISRTTGLRVFVALPVTDATGGVVGCVVLSRTPASLGETIWGKRYALLELGLVLIAGGVLLAAGISRLVTRPLSVVVAQAQAVAAGGTMERLGRPGTREVAELSFAIARMADTLEKRAEYIRGFAASVSHEFKTPMAAIRAAGELLDDHAASISPDEQQHLLGVVSNGVARLELLVRRMVELARADMLRAGTGREAVAAIGVVLARVADRYRERGISVTVAGGAGFVGLPGDALDSMLTSLLENAATHASGAEIRISAETVGGEVLLTVRDNGPGIPPAHRDRIFEPFFTTSRAEGGTGLGLPIVRAIAESVGGSVVLLPAAAGTEFLVRLPAVADFAT